MWEKARQDVKQTLLRRGLSVGLVPCGISKGAGKTGSHLTWPEVIKLHHHLVQKDKKRARSERSLSKQDELVSGGGTAEKKIRRRVVSKCHFKNLHEFGLISWRFLPKFP